MTNEETQLLLKDLCARLPYGIKAHTKIGTDIIVAGVIDYTVKDETEDSFDISFITPYLRYFTSMTEKERQEYEATCIDWYETLETYDWLNAHHFDYRGLIGRGLAIEAPEGMYKTE